MELSNQMTAAPCWIQSGASGQTNLFHQTIVQAQQLSLFVVFQDKLAGPHLGFLAQHNFRTEVPLQLVKSSANICILRDAHRHAGGASAACSQSFDLTDRQSTTRSPVRVAHSELWVNDG